MTGVTRAAWALTAFVAVGGAVLWAVTGRAAFAVFVVLGLLTGVGAWLTGRTPGAGRAATDPTPGTRRPTSTEEIP